MNRIPLIFETHPISPSAKKIRLAFRGAQLLLGTVCLCLPAGCKERNVTIAACDRGETVNRRNVEKNHAEDLIGVEPKLVSIFILLSPILVGGILMQAIKIVNDFYLRVIEDINNFVVLESLSK
jgi:hypothetical protein